MMGRLLMILASAALVVGALWLEPQRIDIRAPNVAMRVHEERQTITGGTSSTQTLTNKTYGGGTGTVTGIGGPGQVVTCWTNGTPCTITSELR